MMVMKKRIVGTVDVVVNRLARAGLNHQEDDVRKTILKAFAEEGKAPDVAKIAKASGLSPEEVLRICRTLAAKDLIVWEESEAQILGAYPFSGRPTAHHVTIEGGNTLYAMCTIDALGIPFMLGQGAAIASSCFACQQPVKVEIHDGLIRQADPSTTVVWFSEREGCCVAEARCPLINFFCEEDHLQRWLGEHPHERGTVLTLTEAIKAGKAIFGDLLK